MNRDRITERSIIICRCSDVTLERLRDLIESGYTTFDEIKRITRMGMGSCQGKTCTQLVMREIATVTGKAISDQCAQTARPPAVGVRLELIAKGANDDVQ